MRRGFFRYLENHKAVVWALIIALLALVGWADYALGYEISVSFFYLFPVALAAWFIGAPTGLVVSVAAGVIWHLTDIDSGHVYSSEAIAYWNALARVLFFSVTAVSLCRIRRFMFRERRLAALKSEMVSLVSHEVSNALVAISLASNLLEEEEGENIAPNRKKFYAIMAETRGKLSRLVKTFLAKARLESGKFGLELQRVELRRLVDGLLAPLDVLADEKGVSVTTSFPAEIVPVKCDPDVIGLVIGNLIGNGVKYTPRGGKVSITVSEPGADGQVEVSVRDTGIGIAREEIKKVLTGFYRTETAAKEAAGFGIGLKASREFLEAHGSVLMAESEPGRGSRFYFRLPVWK